MVPLLFAAVRRYILAAFFFNNKTK